MSYISGTVIVDNFDASDNSKKFNAEPNGWRCYLSIPTTKNGGAQISAGSFKRVKVYCPAQKWLYAGGETHSTQTPLGTSNSQWPTGLTPTYPNAYRWGVVLFQVSKSDNGDDTVTYHQITATDLANAQEIELDSQVKNIYVAVNDNVGAYFDNSGDFSIQVQLLKD